MRRIHLFAALALVCGLGVGWTALAQNPQGEKKRANEQEPPKDLKAGEKTKSLQDLALASKLIAFGREHKNAESLLLAAKIIHGTPTEKIKADKSEVSGDKMEVKAKDNSPKALIAEAKAMSSAPHIMALAAATQQVVDEAARGLVGGAYQSIRTVGPGQTWTVSGLTFRGGELAEVDIDLFGVFGRGVLTVHDGFGNLIRTDAIPGNFYNCKWVPLFTGSFTVRFTNTDTIALRCDLLTN